MDLNYIANVVSGWFWPNIIKLCGEGHFKQRVTCTKVRKWGDVLFTGWRDEIK